MLVKFLRYGLRKFYFAIAIFLIIAAVIVQTGRSLAPLVGDYKPELTHYLAEKFNAKVALGEVSLAWRGLKPVVGMDQFTITNHENEPILAFERARLRLDLLRTVVNRQLVWGSVVFDGASLSFQQDEKGFWRIPGLPEKDQAQKISNNSAGIDRLIDTLLLINRMEFRNTELNFKFLNGQQFALIASTLRLENDRDFHRLELQVDAESRKDAAHLLLESQGDPRLYEQVVMSGYLALNDLPTSEPLAAAMSLLLGGIEQTHLRSEGGLDGKLWFTSRAQNQGYDLRGSLALQTLSVPLFDGRYRLESFSTAIDGYWLRNGQWQLSLADINAGLYEARLENLQLKLSAAANQPLLIELDKFDLGEWQEGINESGVLAETPIGKILSTLNPSGFLDSIRVQVPLHEPRQWQAEAMANNVSVDAWGGVPALTGVSGYLKVSEQAGSIDLDSREQFTMHYHPTFDEPMVYDQASGQVAWWLMPDKNRIYVNSGKLSLKAGDEQAAGYLYLALPFKAGTEDIDLYLHIGAKNIAAKEYQKYTPAILSDELTHWLKQSIGQDNPGKAREGGFIFRGTLTDKDPIAKSFQLYLDLEHANLNYHQDWPAVSQATGKLLLNNQELQVDITQGKLLQSDIQQVSIATEVEAEETTLHIQGEVIGSASDGLEVLRSGFLRTLMGDNLDTWHFQGEVKTAVALAIPLGESTQDGSHQVDIELSLATADLADLRLLLSDVQGKLRYTSQEGLSSEQLIAQVFDHSVTAQVTTALNIPYPSTTISLAGQVSPEDLAHWLERPEPYFADGVLPFTTDIIIAHASEASRKLKNPRVLTVKGNSLLTDVEFNLPASLSKTKEDSREISFAWEKRKLTSRLMLNYRAQEQPLFDAIFLFNRQNQQLQNVDIAFGRVAELQTLPQFRISGELPTFELKQWEQLAERYSTYQQQLEPALQAQAQVSQAPATDLKAGQVAGLPLRLDMALGEQVIGPLKLEQLRLKAAQQQNAWQVVFDNPLLRGELSYPLDRRLPMKLNISELHLSQGAFDVNDFDHLIDSEDRSAMRLSEQAETFDPRSLPLADVSIDALHVDGINHGEWHLRITPKPDGVVFERIVGNLTGLHLTGAGDEPNKPSATTNGATLSWTINSLGQQTRIKGVIYAEDMADVMRYWNKPNILESTNARYELDLGWPGSPGELSLTGLTGQVDLSLSSGRFNRSTGAGDGLLRLLSLVNFDTLARRLRLDFSDLYKSGLAYDQIDGVIGFEHGQIHFIEPLVVQGPSSRLQMAGNINLLDETINTRLIAALPVAGNLTFLAAVATGLPAAAGIYLVSKLFRKQVDQATSVSYIIKGVWDNPSMNFDRLFENEDD